MWALSVCDISGIPLDVLPVCDNSDLPSVESGNLLSVTMDSGAEEHVVSLPDWKSLGEPLLNPAQVRFRSGTGDDMGVSGSFVVRRWCEDKLVKLTALVATRATRSLCSATKLVGAGYSIEMRPTQCVLNHSGGGGILLRRCGKRDSSEKISGDQCHHFFRHEARGTVSQELRAMRAGHLSASEVRLPWTPEEKHRHEVNGHAEYDKRCEICVKSCGGASFGSVGMVATADGVGKSLA